MHCVYTVNVGVSQSVFIPCMCDYQCTLSIMCNAMDAEVVTSYLHTYTYIHILYQFLIVLHFPLFPLVMSYKESGFKTRLFV